jgi:hypothetical protein
MDHIFGELVLLWWIPAHPLWIDAHFCGCIKPGTSHPFSTFPFTSLLPSCITPHRTCTAPHFPCTLDHLKHRVDVLISVPQILQHRRHLPLPMCPSLYCLQPPTVNLSSDIGVVSTHARMWCKDTSQVAQNFYMTYRGRSQTSVRSTACRSTSPSPI